MTSLWNAIERNAKVLSIVVAALGLIVAIITGARNFVTTDVREPALVLGSLRDSKTVTAYPGFTARHKGEEESPVCARGVPLYGTGVDLNRFTLAHDRHGPHSIEVRSIRIVHEYSQEHLDAYQLEASLNQQQGLGPKEPYRFFAFLNGRSISFDKFSSPDGQVHRPEGNDLLSGKGARYIELTDQPGDDAAVLDGTLEATEPGLYAVHLEVDYTVSGKLHTQSTEPLCILAKFE